MKTITWQEYWDLSDEETENFTGILKKEDGTIQYFKNGSLHREDGPALIFHDGYEYYYQNDELHRLDGPADIHPDGSCEYYIHNIKTSKEGLELYVSLLKLKSLI